MSRMLRSILPLLIVVSATASVWPAPADEPSEMLARAEALYYEADFAKSIELLLRADELLGQQTGHLQEKTAVKLQLALGYIGLNTAPAQRHTWDSCMRWIRITVLILRCFRPRSSGSPMRPRAEQSELRCRSLADEAQRQLATGNSDAVVKLIGASAAKCSALAALNPKAAELLFKEGLDAYKKSHMEDAR